MLINCVLNTFKILENLINWIFDETKFSQNTKTPKSFLMHTA